MIAKARLLPIAVLLALLCLILPAPRALADFEDGLKSYQAGEFRAAFEEWIELARDGDPAAMRNIGHLYRWGHGVQQDLPTAAEWYRRAADTGLDRAQANLAMMYLEGQGVPEDPAQAAYWFSQAAIQGHTVAQFNLAQLYQQGRGVQRNEALALGWLQRAAKAGHPGALAQLSALVATAPPPAPALQRKEAPPGSDAPPAAPPVVMPPRVDPASGETLDPPAASGESLEAPSASAMPEILDRLAGVFGSGDDDKEEMQEPAAPPQRDPQSGTIVTPPASAAPPPPAATGAVDAEGRAANGDRTDAEKWVLALIEDTVTGGSEQTEPPAPQERRQPAAAPPSDGAAGPPVPTPDAAAAPAPSPAASTLQGAGAAPLPPGSPAAEAEDAMTLYREGRHDEARQALGPFAAAGMGRAQYLLGWMNEAGSGGPADPALAYYWYMRASTTGNLEGRRALESLQRRIDPALRSKAEAWLRSGGPPGKGS